MLTATAPTARSAQSVDRPDAARIRPITRAEARALGTAEVERFLALVESLGPGDWDQPTACTLWTVRDILAHQAGAYAGYAGLREFRRQFVGRPAPGQLFEDFLSARQVADRAGRSPAELIAELRAVGPRAVANRARFPLPVRLLGMPYPLVGVLQLGYLLDLIYTRDTWMHRLDIARATGREMLLTAQHDGRIVALVVRDLARMLAPKLGGKSVAYELTGPSGGSWRIGRAPTAAATMRLDTLDFNLLASGRYAVEQAGAVIEGDRALADLALRETRVMY
jgi:uncharacterized protein (TIGR03083 family)